MMSLSFASPPTGMRSLPVVNWSSFLFCSSVKAWHISQKCLNGHMVWTYFNFYSWGSHPNDFSPNKMSLLSRNIFTFSSIQWNLLNKITSGWSNNIKRLIHLSAIFWYGGIDPVPANTCIWFYEMVDSVVCCSEPTVFAFGTYLGFMMSILCFFRAAWQQWRQFNQTSPYLFFVMKYIKCSLVKYKLESIVEQRKVSLCQQVQTNLMVGDSVVKPPSYSVVSSRAWKSKFYNKPKYSVTFVICDCHLEMRRNSIYNIYNY